MTAGTLGGYALNGVSGNGWVLKDSTRPHAWTFVLEPAQVDKLVGNGLAPITLVQGDETYRNLFAIQRVAAPLPQFAGVKVVDWRWFWTTRIYLGTFNQRRKTGVKRLTDPTNLQPDEAMSTTPTISYAPFSLRDGTTAWTAPELLKLVFDSLKETLPKSAGFVPRLQFRGSVEGVLAAIPIENLTLQGTRADALAQVMSYIPWCGVFIDPVGDVVIYRKSSGGERSIVVAAGPEKVGGGHIAWTTLDNLRPSKIRVCFLRALEVRFDYEELDSASLSVDSRYLENVAPVPDYSISVGGETYAEGTWLTIQQLLTAWGNAPGINRPLTLEDLRRSFVPFNDLWSKLLQNGLSIADANWPARLSCLQEHYRQTYRINRRWMDRIATLTASRVGTIYAPTGGRGNAPCYSDFAYLPSARSVAQDILRPPPGMTNGDLSYVTNCPRFGGGNISATSLASPARVSIVDEDQGIIRFDFVGDRYGVHVEILPSQTEMNTDTTQPGAQSKASGPTGDLTHKTRPKMFDVLGRGNEYLRLTKLYKCATIVTATPGMGNFADSMAQFEWVEVSPGDVKKFVGQENCNGPEVDILIGPGIERARIVWDDNLSLQTEKAFGVGTAAAGKFPIPALRAQTINYSSDLSDGLPSGGASLAKIALAAATRVWHALGDRMQGSATFDLVPGLEPAGWLSEVGTRIESSGEMLTTLSLPAEVPQFSLESYLDATTRRTVLRLADPTG